MGIRSPIFINDSLCAYYKKLWDKCKKLWLNIYIYIYIYYIYIFIIYIYIYIYIIYIYIFIIYIYILYAMCYKYYTKRLINLNERKFVKAFIYVTVRDVEVLDIYEFL